MVVGSTASQREIGLDCRSAQMPVEDRLGRFQAHSLVAVGSCIRKRWGIKIPQRRAHRAHVENVGNVNNANGDDMTVTCKPIDPEALAIPAPYVNRFQISILRGALVRIAFAEALAAGAKGRSYRAAVMMPAGDAREMALAILNGMGSTPPTPS
jgi:hypothetical protein